MLDRNSKIKKSTLEMTDPRSRFLRNLEYKIRYWCYSTAQEKLCAEADSSTYIDKPLILISEIQRSGGTLLSQLFDGHTEIFAYPSEIEIGYPLKWDWLTNISTTNDIFLFEKLCDRLIVKMGRHGEYRKEPLTGPLKEKAFDFKFDLKSYKKILKDEINKTEKNFNKTKIYNACMTAFFNAWRNYHDRDPICWDAKKFVCGFVPRLIMLDKSVDDFFETCPEGKIVTVIRSPASWYASARAHGYEDIKNAMDLWAQSAQASINLAERRPDACKQLFFDDLVLDNQKVMEDVARFCGLKWEDILLQPTFNGFDTPSNSRFESKLGVDTGTVDRWRKHLGDDELSYIEDYVSNKTAFDIDGRIRGSS